MTIRTLRVGSRVLQIPAGGPIVIDPESSIPANYGPGKTRWSISPETIGMIERICRARFEVQSLVPGVTEEWTEVKQQSAKFSGGQDVVLQLDSTDEVIGTIAQSVYASTKIEGEEVFAEDVPLAIIGRPSAREAVQDDYPDRVKGSQDTYKAYIWALSQPSPLAGGGLINVDFIFQLHKHMFFRTKPAAAGKPKSANNQIVFGERALLTMLPFERVEEFLTRLCDRLNSQFKIADNSGRYSKLLAIGEFVLDFLAIHPFGDGNGRTARLLSTYLLERAGFHFARFYSLDSVILDRHAEYYHVLFESQRHWYAGDEDITPWIEFYMSSIFAQWLRAHEEILRRQTNS